MWQLQQRRRLLRVVWAARALERRISLRSGLALTEGRGLGEGARRGVVEGVTLRLVVTGGGIGGSVGGEEGAARWGMGVVPIVVGAALVGVGSVGAGGGVLVGYVWGACVST